MKFIKVTILLSACVLLGACSKANNSNSTNATGNTASAAASPKATAEAAKSPSAAKEVNNTSTPEEAADGLLNAWKKKDRTLAAKFATDAAFNKLFKEGGDEGGPEGLESQGCSEESGVYNCGYTYEGGALIMHVKGSEESGYKVQSIEFIAD